MAMGQGRVMAFFSLQLPGFNRLPALQAQVPDQGIDTSDPIRVFHCRGHFRSNSASQYFRSSISTFSKYAVLHWTRGKSVVVARTILWRIGGAG
jgi:hypothetical protein